VNNIFRDAAKKSGHKAFLHVKYPTITAMMSRAGSDICDAQLLCEFEIKRGTTDHSEWWLYLRGGSPGYESVELTRLLSEEHAPDAVWVACMGSQRYRRMEVKIKDIREAVANYSVNYRFDLL